MLNSTGVGWDRHDDDDMREMLQEQSQEAVFRLRAIVFAVVTIISTLATLAISWSGRL